MSAGIVTSLRRLVSDTNPLRLAWHRSKAYLAALRYGFPARRLTVIGVTGTDGKTTTVGMLAHILNTCGHPTGALSTAYFSVKGTMEFNATQKTSPSPFAIQGFLRRLVREGCTHAVLEYSSHGLVQGRTAWTYPRVAAITNISPEHLDYHKTMEEYARAKSLLFRMLDSGVKVLNALDATYDRYAAIPSKRTIAYGTATPKARHDALWAADIALTPRGTSATVHCRAGGKEDSQPLSLGIPGDFNVQNALCAIGCAMGAGVGFGAAAMALGSFAGVPGRMERIDEGQPFAVFVDFTVTPASYERTLGTLKTMLAGGRLLVLMGSCGDRMKEKRPIIGSLAGRLADVVVVTNEDPYTEDPEQIIDQVLAGMHGARADVHRIVDRGEAIRFLLGQAKPGDIVVFCGKGSDTTMWTAQGKIPWNEREIVRNELRSLQK
jgi:UDP-N-acetylmuramoyl-L-alanyl-D-glutamate--2,6-diaminopimelate ligase